MEGSADHSALKRLEPVQECRERFLLSEPLKLVDATGSQAHASVLSLSMEVQTRSGGLVVRETVPG